MTPNWSGPGTRWSSGPCVRSPNIETIAWMVCTAPLLHLSPPVVLPLNNLSVLQEAKDSSHFQRPGVRIVLGPWPWRVKCICSSHACWDVWHCSTLITYHIAVSILYTDEKKQLEYTVKDSILRLTMVTGISWCLPTRHIIFAPNFVSEKLWSTMVRWLECRSLDLSSCWMFISKAVKWTSVYLKCQVEIGR